MATLVARRLEWFWWMMLPVGVALVWLGWHYLSALGRGHRQGEAGSPAGVKGVLAAMGTRPRGGWAHFWSHLLRDGLAHPDLLRTDRARWLAHQSMAAGFLGLATLSFLAALSEHVLLPLGWGGSVAAALRDMDQPFMAALHETLGLMLLAGGLFAGARRLLWRGDHLPNTGPDAVVVGLLLLVAVGGYPLEALRLLMESVPPDVARFSYVAWPLARGLAPLSLDWDAWHFWAFQAHVVASVALFLYWPLSKLMHLFAGPVMVALDRTEARPSR